MKNLQDILKSIFFLMILFSFQKGISQNQLKEKVDITTEEFELDELKREFMLFIPKTIDKTVENPLVVVLHGGGGNMKNFAKKTTWVKQAIKSNFIVAFLQASPLCLKRDGEEQTKNFWLTKEKEAFLCDPDIEVDDILYVDNVIEIIKSKVSVDENKMFAVGFSNGMGFLLQNILTERPNLFKAIGGVGSMVHKPYTVKSEIPIYVILGDKDGRALQHSGLTKYALDADSILLDPVQGNTINYLKEYLGFKVPEGLISKSSISDIQNLNDLDVEKSQKLLKNGKSLLDSAKNMKLDMNTLKGKINLDKISVSKITGLFSKKKKKKTSKVESITNLVNGNTTEENPPKVTKLKKSIVLEYRLENSKSYLKYELLENIKHKFPAANRTSNYHDGALILWEFFNTLD